MKMTRKNKEKLQGKFAEIIMNKRQGGELGVCIQSYWSESFYSSAECI